MKNFALWYERFQDKEKGGNEATLSSDVPSPITDEVNADIHFNFWRVPKPPIWKILFTKKFWVSCWRLDYLWRVKDRNFHRALDIGIKIDKIDGIENICFFIPDITITNDDIEDLGASITGNILLLNAVFNENVNLKKDFAKNYATVTIVAKDKAVPVEDFTVAIFNDKEYYSLEEKYGGKILKIHTKGHSGRFYLRFRLKKESLFYPIHLVKPNDSIFQSALTLDEIIDFRFNEVRGLPEKLFADISNNSNKDKYFNIKKIHFLYICSSKEEFVLGHQDFTSCRLLENDIWESYVDGLDIGGEKFVAYHWKEKAENGGNVESFNAFIKTRFQHSNWSVILKYLIFIMIIGLFTNWLYDFMKDNLSYFYKAVKNFNNK